MLLFWPMNFGVLLLLVAWLGWRLAKDERAVWPRALFFPALFIFLLCCFVKFAPWEWDNTKIMIWSYLAIVPLAWQRAARRAPALDARRRGGAAVRVRLRLAASADSMGSIAASTSRCAANSTAWRKPCARFPLERALRGLSDLQSPAAARRAQSRARLSRPRVEPRARLPGAVASAASMR